MGLGTLRTSALKSMAVFACVIMTTSHSDAEVLPSSVSPIFDVACTAPFEDPQRFRNALPNAHIVEHLVTDIGNQPGRAKTVLSLNGLNTVFCVVNDFTGFGKLASAVDGYARAWFAI